MTEKKPDLGNTRINGFSEGLARGDKLTGRINRAVSIGEDAMRQNGAAFDSHTRKNAAGDTYFCPDCRAWMSDATVGVHDRRNPTHSSQVRDASGNLKGAHWAKEERANADPRAEREDKISALEKKGGDAWAEYENLAKQAEREKDASRKSQLTDQARAKKKESYDAQSAAMELKRQRHNAGDSAKAIIVQSGGGATGWIIADSEGRRLYGPFPSYSAAEADFKRRNLEMANAGDEGFLGDTMSGMDVDAGQAQEGLAPAEDADVLANSKAGVKRGAQKYGKI